MAASCPSLRVRCRSGPLSCIRDGRRKAGHVLRSSETDSRTTFHPAAHPTAMSRCLAPSQKARDRSTLAHVRVWLSDWEWQCCGEPFSVGNEVAWGLVSLPADDQYLVGVLGAEVAAGLTHRETHHADEGERPVPTRV